MEDENDIQVIEETANGDPGRESNENTENKELNKSEEIVVLGQKETEQDPSDQEQDASKIDGKKENEKGKN